MRTVATCQFWRLPTTVEPSKVRSAADLVTGLDEDGQPLLVAFPDDETIRPRGTRRTEAAGSIEMSSPTSSRAGRLQYSQSPIGGG